MEFRYDFEDAQGEVISVFGVFKNITKQEDVFEKLKDAMWVVSKGIILFHNKKEHLMTNNPHKTNSVLSLQFPQTSKATLEGNNWRYKTLLDLASRLVPTKNYGDCIGCFLCGRSNSLSLRVFFVGVCHLLRRGCDF